MADGTSSAIPGGRFLLLWNQFSNADASPKTLESVLARTVFGWFAGETMTKLTMAVCAFLLAVCLGSASGTTWDEYLDGNPGMLGVGQWWYNGAPGSLSSVNLGDGNWAYRMVSNSAKAQIQRTRWPDPAQGLTVHARFKAVSASGAQALRLQLMDGSYGRLQMEWQNGTWTVVTGVGNSWAMPADTWTTIWFKMDSFTQQYKLWVLDGQSWNLVSTGQGKTTPDAIDLRFGSNAVDQTAETWLDFWYVYHAGAFAPDDPNAPVRPAALLLNGDFEAGYWRHPFWASDGYVGAAWTEWSVPPPPSRYVNPVDPTMWHSPGEIQSADSLPGNEFQRIITYMDSWYAGIVQTVPTIAGKDYDLEMDLKVADAFPGMLVGSYGYDLTGQTFNPQASTVVWADPGTVLDRDQWSHYHTRLSATGPATSVWISGLKATKEGAENGAHLDIDNVSLTEATEPLINIVDGPQARQLSDSSFEIIWETDVPSASTVQYDPDWQNDDEGIKYDLQTVQTGLTQQHSVVVTGLDPQHVYTYRVVSEAPGYEAAVSRNATFETPGPAEPFLRNGGFDDLDDQYQHTLAPWKPFTVYPALAVDGLVGPYPSSGTQEWWGLVKANEGSYFLGSMASHTIKGGGVCQRVQAVPGETYQASFDYVTIARAANASEETPGPFGIGDAQWSDVQVWVGIDPMGGVDPLNPGIVWAQKWSEDYRIFPAPETNLGVWTDDFTTPPVVAQSNAVTVFVRLVQLWGLQVNLMAVDDVRLTGATPEPTEVASVGKARQLADHSFAEFTADSVVTLVPLGEAGVFYAQDPDGSAGIRVETTMPTLPSAGAASKTGSGTAWISTVGDSVRLKGVIGTNPNGERVLRDATFTLGDAQATTPIRYITNRSLGGETYIDSAGHGAENQGLLVMISGRVSYVNYIDSYFLLDDGSQVDPLIPGQRGVKIIDSSSIPAEGEYLTIVGVITAERVNGQNIRVLRARSRDAEMEVRNP